MGGYDYISNARTDDFCANEPYQLFSNVTVYHQPHDETGKGGQGSYGWRNFKKFLRDIPEIIPVARIFERFVRPLFVMRSHPRWGKNCWKAKT